MRFFVLRINVKLLIILGAAAACVLLCVILDAAVPTFSVNGRNIPIYSVERDDNKIAITFDCAWNADDIESILDTLDRYNCKANFFVLGEWAEKYPYSVKEIYERGHLIGTHSMSHKSYTSMTADEMMRDINQCENIILNITGDKPFILRAPSGAYNDRVVEACEENNRIYIQWSVDGLDYTDDATEESIYSRVVNNTSAGDIILLHNGTAHTADVLPRILEALTERYEPVKLLDLIYMKDFTLDNAGRQYPVSAE